MKHITLIALLAMATVACKKSTTEPEHNGLIGCPVNTTCTRLYTDQADADSLTGQLKPGNYRVFWNEVVKAPLTTKLIIKAPIVTAEFTMGKADIVAGKAIFLQNCPVCDIVPFKPIDGQIKGQKATDGNWLIEATVILKSPAPLNHRDTLRIKNHFKPNFVLN